MLTLTVCVTPGERAYVVAVLRCVSFVGLSIPWSIIHKLRNARFQAAHTPASPSSRSTQRQMSRRYPGVRLAIKRVTLVSGCGAEYSLGYTCATNNMARQRQRQLAIKYSDNGLPS